MQGHRVVTIFFPTMKGSEEGRRSLTASAMVMWEPESWRFSRDGAVTMIIGGEREDSLDSDSVLFRTAVGISIVGGLSLTVEATHQILKC